MSARNRPENKTARRHARIVRHAEADEQRQANEGVAISMGLARMFNGWRLSQPEKPTGPRVGQLDQHRSVNVPTAVTPRQRKKAKR